MSAERLQKILAAAGLGSRRECERLISEGRVTVNGKVIELGDKALLTDDIRLNGRRIATPSKTQTAHKVLMYHKPEGEVCTRRDPEERPTVFAALPRLKTGRWINIGRLDLNTSGLLLFTTDGELANRLTHPSYEVEREYSVRVFGAVDKTILDKLLAGVTLEDGPAKFLSIEDGGGEGRNHWYNVVLREGRKREVRRLWESQGLQVSRLIRIRFGTVQLAAHLRQGQHRLLEAADVQSLYAAADLPFE
ncbi:MAG: pseudouridine synthase [Gammaproteobacteria bacterium]|nr:pseudouridine synthase [Gammaproteobacteria bacterium]